MSELAKELTDRLNEISQKLDNISDTFNNLISSMDNMSSNLANQTQLLFVYFYPSLASFSRRKSSSYQYNVYH